MLIFSISIDYIRTWGEAAAYFPYGVTSNQASQLCGGEIHEIRYYYQPPHDARVGNSVGVLAVKGSRLTVTVDFQQKIQKQHHVKDGYYISDDAGKTWHLLGPITDY